MSQLTQFTGSGSSSPAIAPKGTITTQMPYAADALLESNGEYYVKTGTRVLGLSPAQCTNILAQTDDFMLPVSQTTLGSAQSSSYKYAQSFAYGNGVYLRGTPNGLIRSTDAISWTPVEISNAYTSTNANTSIVPFSKVVFGAGLFLTVVDTSGSSAVVPSAIVIASSTDGLSWTLSSVATHYSGEPLSGNSLNLPMAGLDFDGTNFWLSIQQYDSAGTTCYICSSKSTDGKTWTPVYKVANGSYFYAKWKVVVGNSNQMIIAPMAGPGVSGVVYTAYGTTSAATSYTQPFTEQFSQAKFLNNLFFVLRNVTSSTSALSTSPTGASWTSRTLPTATILYDITYGNSTYVAVGEGGRIFTSTDASTWTSQTSGTSEQLVSVEWDASLSLFICVGVTTIRTSSTGTTWSAATIPSGLGTRSSNIQVPGSCALLTKLNGTWFTTLGSSDHILTSTDGTTWVAPLIGGALSSTSVVIAGSTAVATTNSLFKLNTLMVACPAAGGLMIAPLSTNSWTAVVTPATGIFRAVSYGAGLYVAVGNGGIIYTSSDGITWTSRTSGTATDLTGIEWSGSEFIAISSTVAIRSTNGTTWASAGSNGGTYMCYSGDKFIVLSSNTTLRTSPTGVDWITNTITDLNNMRPFSAGAVIFGGSTGNAWIVTQNGNRIIGTNSVVDSATEINGTLYLTSNSVPGYWLVNGNNYTISSSTASAISDTTGNASAGHGYSITSFQSGRSGIKVGSNTYVISIGSSNVGASYGMSIFMGESSRLLGSAAVAFYNGANIWSADGAGINWASKAMACSLTTPQAIWASNSSVTPSTLSNYPLSIIGYRKIT
jgi:hypothetical protein